MSKLMQAEGEYINKATDEVVKFDFSYLVIDSTDDAVSELGEEKTKSILQRMIKTDARNGASLKAQAENKHNARAGMSEEDKAEKKAERKANVDILAKLKASGLSIDELLNR